MGCAQVPKRIGEWLLHALLVAIGLIISVIVAAIWSLF